MVTVAISTENISSITEILFRVLLEEHNQLLLQLQYRVMARMKKMFSCLKNQIEKTTNLERNEDKNIQTRQFAAQCSSIIIRQVLCSCINWHIQNPVEHLRNIM